jgi:uncharacterized protein (TIGR03083 family)
MTTTTIEVSRIPALEHDEAMALASVEYDRLAAAARALAPDDWQRRTDCPAWTVQQLLAHNLGNMEAAASVPRLATLQLKAMRRAKREGIEVLDAMTAIQVDERAGLSPAELIAGIERVAPKAVAGRRRTPGILRRKVRIPIGDGGPNRPLGFLIDAVFTRDVWMHRVDLSRATGHPMEITAEHDGRIVADIVGEWVRAHGQPCTLVLGGPAGGTYVAGGTVAGERIEIDAVEFCRTLSGRAAGSGLLSTTVPF